MGRPANITYEDFAAAAAAMIANGQKLTFASARERLGGGSYHVLRRYIDKFEADAAQSGAGTGIPPLLQALANQARDEALREARVELLADAEALEADRAALAEEHEGMRVAVATAEARAIELRRQVDELQSDRESLHQRVDVERRRAEDLAGQLAAALATQATLKQAHELVVAEASQQAHAGAHQFARDLEAAQQRFEGVQQHTLRLVDDIRAKHVAVVEQLLAKQLEVSSEALRKALEQLDALPQRVVDARTVGQQVGQHVVQNVEATVATAATRLLEAIEATRAQLQAHVDRAIERAAVATATEPPAASAAGVPPPGGGERTRKR